MTSVLIEHGQYVDDAGLPIALGLLYIGTNGADPVATAGVTTIFSDRALTVAITNPQTLDSFGRSDNKIWVSGTYSIQVNNSAEVQKFQDLDAGSDTSTVNATLFVTSVIGSNTITGSTSDPLSSYLSNQQFVFETAGVNAAGGITLNVDGVGAKAVVKNNDQAILVAEFEANQVVIVAYNATNDNFEWVNQNNKVIDFYEGTAVVAASSTDIWATDGNTIHVTGTTGITSFGTAPNVGALRRVIFDAAVTLTNSTNLALPGGADYTTVAGDVLWVYADTTTQFDVIGIPATINSEFNVTGSAPKFACRAWVVFDGVGTVSIYESGNVSSITDDGVGIYTVNFATALPDGNYSFGGVAEDSSTGGSAPTIAQRAGGTRSTTALGITTQIGIDETDFDFVCIQVIR